MAMSLISFSSRLSSDLPDLKTVVVGRGGSKKWKNYDCDDNGDDANYGRYAMIELLALVIVLVVVVVVTVV
eukprot:8097348-Pyramimonas_sp.AAC.1